MTSEGGIILIYIVSYPYSIKTLNIIYLITSFLPLRIYTPFAFGALSSLRPSSEYHWAAAELSIVNCPFSIILVVPSISMPIPRTPAGAEEGGLLKSSLEMKRKQVPAGCTSSLPNRTRLKLLPLKPRMHVVAPQQDALKTVAAQAKEIDISEFHAAGE